MANYNMEYPGAPAVPPNSTPFISMGSQLLGPSGLLAPSMQAPPSRGFDLVLCDICDKDVPIYWHLDAAGSQVHQIEAHDRESHIVCKHCHDLVTNGVFPRDVPGQGVRQYNHDELCAAQQAVRYCTHCGLAFADKEWFLREHLGPCLQEAQWMGTRDGYFKENGKPRYGAVNGLHLRGGMKRATGGRSDETKRDATLFAYSEDPAAAKSKFGVRGPKPMAKSKPARDTSDYVRFYCGHCGVAVSDATWFLREHLVKCTAEMRGSLRMYSKHTGLRKSKNRPDQQARAEKKEGKGNVPGDPLYLGAEPRDAKSAASALPRRQLLGPETSLSIRPKNASTNSKGPEGVDHEFRLHCEHCGDRVVDEIWYRRKHLLRCLADHKGMLNMYDKQTGLRKNKRQDRRPDLKAGNDLGGLKYDSYRPGVVPPSKAREGRGMRSKLMAGMDKTPLSQAQAKAIKTTAPDLEAADKDILFNCQRCGIAVTDQQWYLQEHLPTCLEVARDLDDLEQQVQTAGDVEMSEELPQLRLAPVRRDLRMVRWSSPL